MNTPAASRAATPSHAKRDIFALAALLPEGVSWFEPLTPEIAGHIADLAAQPASPAPLTDEQIDNMLSQLNAFCERHNASEYLGLPMGCTEDAQEMRQLARAALASPQVAPAPVPDGFALVPVRMTKAMQEVTDEEGWQWSDVLAASETVDEDAENWYRKAEEAIYTMELDGCIWNDGEWCPPIPRDAAPVQVAPPGFKLVPVEPTAEMMAAAWDHTPLHMYDMTDGDFGQAYKDMIAAAPVQVAPPPSLDEILNAYYKAAPEFDAAVLQSFVDAHPVHGPALLRYAQVQLTSRPASREEVEQEEIDDDQMAASVESLHAKMADLRSTAAPVAPQDDARDAARYRWLLHNYAPPQDETQWDDMDLALHDGTSELGYLIDAEIAAAKPTEEQRS